ncbi:hypothetical protein OG345_02700 [Streptomyces sp. NBC_01220]|uniref:hypothetical protein n=1 Tax=unclassified Streptomyces TaxID=2593676 RepID=UPI002E2EE266|nr:hypothetical protein [Streptomyces sp. NBC_01358]WSQ41994.1 hypothetical protein OG345_02700 [Streptomyces sp. NBC_01220]
MDLSPLQLAVQRLRDAEAAADASRADVELEAVLAVRAGAGVEAVSGVAGITPHDLLRLEKLTGDIPPG